MAQLRADGSFSQEYNRFASGRVIKCCFGFSFIAVMAGFGDAPDDDAG